MSKKIIVLAIAALMVSSIVFTLEAAPKDRRMMRHAGYRIMMAEKNLLPARMLLKFKDDIGLTEDQVGKIEKMQEARKEAKIKKQADIKVQELKFNSYLKGDKVDRGKMEKMIRTIAKMRTDSQIETINYLLDLKEILTPEQVKKIDELKKDRMHKRMKSRGSRRAPRGDAE